MASDNPHEAVDLPWLAFRYVAGELDPVESAAFEQRLAVDLSACEAVAEAVALREAVLMATADVLPMSRRRRSSVRLRLAALAATLAMAATVGLVLRGAPDRSTVEPVGNPETALAWADLRAASDWDESLDEWKLGALVEIEPPDDEDDDSDSEPPLPSWMVELATLGEPPSSAEHFQ